MVLSEIDIVAYQYLTKTEALESVLPECFQPSYEPMVTVFFSQYNGLEFMGGGGYRTATFQVAARFDGEKDHVQGDLILLTAPTIKIVGAVRPSFDLQAGWA